MRLLSKIRTSLLYRINNRVLDRFWTASEDSLVSKTEHLKRLNIKGDNAQHGVEYTPSSYFALHWTLGLLTRNYPSWTFIDIGAGRGRAVCAAARLPFKRVIGVEFAEELCREAKLNVSKIAPAKVAAGSIEIINVDAVAFSPPPGNCAFYLFNPFNEAVLKPFVDRLIDRQAACGGRVRIAYYNPAHADVLEQNEHIREIHLPLSARLKFQFFAPHHLRLFEAIFPDATAIDNVGATKF